MIQVGTIEKMNGSYQWGTTLEYNGREVRFFIGNHEIIPDNIKEEVKNGKAKAGLFEYNPADQFAYYRDPSALS